MSKKATTSTKSSMSKTNLLPQIKAEGVVASNKKPGSISEKFVKLPAIKTKKPCLFTELVEDEDRFEELLCELEFKKIDFDDFADICAYYYEKHHVLDDELIHAWCEDAGEKKLPNLSDLNNPASLIWKKFGDSSEYARFYLIKMRVENTTLTTAKTLAEILQVNHSLIDTPRSQRSIIDQWFEGLSWIDDTEAATISKALLQNEKLLDKFGGQKEYIKKKCLSGIDKLENSKKEETSNSVTATSKGKLEKESTEKLNPTGR